jgi:DNA invertase Pin-like site-specific DNA recombinase
MRIGYGRVSTRDQNPDGQADALRAAGSDAVFIDKTSGKLARRPELDKALLKLRDGDQIVITKLDRLGRSLELCVPKMPSIQVMRRVGTRGGCRRVGHVCGCRGGRAGSVR